MMILYVLILILTIYLLTKRFSSFTGTYDQPKTCGQAQGHLPGSDIILTEPEKEELLKRFVENT